MDNEMIRDYTARISQANRSELVVIIFELFDYSIEKASKSFDAKKIDEAMKYLRKAQGCVVELRGSLDFQYEISYRLERLYKYVNEQLSASMAKCKPVNFDSIKEVMSGLHDSFVKIAKEDASETVMKNSQQVYAGLTYGKGTLNEVFMNPNEASRGFKA